MKTMVSLAVRIVKTLPAAVLFSSSAALADDTEIFTGGSTSAASNVIFLFDTSGSMGTQEDTGPAYDISTVYDDSAYGFVADHYYLYRPGNGGSIDLATEASSILQNEVLESQINCDDALQSLASNGEYAGKMAYWAYGDGWSAPDDVTENNDSPIDTSDSSAIVECNLNPHTYNGSTYKYLSKSRWFPFTNNKKQGTSSVFKGNGGFTRIWSGNYLNYVAQYGSSGQKSRIEILREAAIDTIESLPENVNLALMRFDGSNGGYVSVAMKSGKQNKDEFIAALNAFTADGSTPITESMHEARLLLTQQHLVYGHQSVSDSRVGDIYQIPDLEACNTTTKLILFSDGEPTNDKASDNYIENLVDDITFPAGVSSLMNNCSNQSGDYGGGCAEELAYYLFHNDEVIVDTIGGFTSAGNAAAIKLEDIANAGGGTFYPASNYEDIKNALLDSAVQTLITPTSFTSPAIAVSSYNSLEISDELYYAVFEPDDSLAWKGNLKRYAISADGIVDADDALAVDATTGFFADDSRSFWSDAVDGNRVTEGGAAALLGGSERSIYVIKTGVMHAFDPDTAGYLSDEDLALDLIADPNAVDPATNLTYRQSLLMRIAGLNDNDTARTAMEDPLHSRPVVVNYDEGYQVVYVASNSGYLHAFNTSDGSEYFAVLPEEVLKNPHYFKNPDIKADDDKVYGLDGNLTYWHNDLNLNGKVDGSDTVYLYIGMRRGGHSYYAFDVTNPNAPALLWQKHGAYTDTDTKNVPTVSSGFERLGQTWSSLRPALVNWNGSDRAVLFAGGGYDPDEDGTDFTGPATRISHDTGNTVYMLDASTGEVLWDAYSALSPADMTSSFPADVTPVDRNADGYVDLLYAADVGGRLWRFDISQEATGSSDFAQGGVIADINTSSADGITGNRRFYNKPDVTWIEDAAEDYILISIGSGYRAHPLSTDIQDYFFLIKDSNGLITPASYSALTLADLTDWETEDATSAEHGWYFSASDEGEKVLSASLILSGIVTFNTYLPGSDSDAALQCSGQLGSSHTYQLALTQDAIVKTQADCAEGESCPVEPGYEVAPVVISTGLAPDPTPAFPPGEDKNGDSVVTCDESEMLILSGTSVSPGHIDRCGLFRTDYWKEKI